MKLILSGSTGLVGTEVIRQCLLNPKVTSLIALTRRPIDTSTIAASIKGGNDIDAGKVKSVVLQDFEKYPDDVKKDLADADACIWALSLTPMRSKQFPWDEVVRVVKGYCVAGMDAIADARHESGRTTPFRFIYMSGRGISREMTKKPMILGEYQLLRAEMENITLDFAASHKDSGWETCIAKPGLISGHPGAVGAIKNAAVTALGWVSHTVSAEQCVVAMIQQCAEGFEKDTLENPDMVRLGRV